MNPTILVVDDEDHIREMLQEYLSKHGFSVREAENAAVARSLLAERPIDLAIMDITMPGEDGLSLARHVKEHHREVAIIMLTAADTVIDRIVELEMGADDYLTKPFDPRELLARIKSVLRRTASSGPLPAAETTRFRFGHCELDLDQRRLFTRDDSEAALTTSAH